MKSRRSLWAALTAVCAAGAVKSQGPVPYVSGGVGEDSEEAMRAVAAGKYKISADSEGKTVSKTATLSTKHKAGMYLYWQATEEDIAAVEEIKKEEERSGHGIHGCW